MFMCFFCRAKCNFAIIAGLRTMRIAYKPFRVIRPLLNGFWRTPSPKYASERVHAESLLTQKGLLR